jgi:chromosome segregation ATPase
MDEATPHMHLGIVPVTKDGRLSAKDIFTPIELKQLQTDFAKDVGKRFKLERGKEGSEAKHLDEISFKLKCRAKQSEELSDTVRSLENRRYKLESSCRDLEKRCESLNKTVFDLGTVKNTLEGEITALEGRLDAVEGDRRNALERFVELPQIKPIFDRFFKEMLENIAKRRQQEKAKKEVWRDSDMER